MKLPVNFGAYLCCRGWPGVCRIESVAPNDHFIRGLWKRRLAQDCPELHLTGDHPLSTPCHSLKSSDCCSLRSSPTRWCSPSSSTLHHLTSPARKKMPGWSEISTPSSRRLPFDSGRSNLILIPRGDTSLVQHRTTEPGGNVPCADDLIWKTTFSSRSWRICLRSSLDVDMELSHSSGRVPQSDYAVRCCFVYPSAAKPRPSSRRVAGSGTLSTE